MLQGISGKSVLDVGTYYGYFPYEAMQRGAARAAGVEMDDTRFAIAHRVAELNGDRYQIHHGRAEDVGFSEPFDIVLFLNVIHHVTDPVLAVANLAKLTRGHMVIEFCTVAHPAYLSEVFSPGRDDRPWTKRSVTTRAKARVASMTLSALSKRLPLMAVGGEAYHRTFYFSKDAFVNMFQLHNNIFSRIEFVGSSTANREVAYCYV